MHAYTVTQKTPETVMMRRAARKAVERDRARYDDASANGGMVIALAWPIPRGGKPAFGWQAYRDARAILVLRERRLFDEADARLRLMLERIAALPLAGDHGEAA